MTTRADYTDDEWKLIMNAPTVAGLGVSMADFGVVSFVDTKAGAEEARGFKIFLVDLSETVANASGEGFLGFGEKVSDKEREYLQKLRTTLAV